MSIKSIKDIPYLKNNKELIELLLLDKTTNKPIIWASNNYVKKGAEFKKTKPILIEHIMSKDIIKPRVDKSKAEQIKRSKDNAEVFTPIWICNLQNNLIDEAWFKRKDVFNKVNLNKSYTTIKSKIGFPKDKSWVSYIKDNRFEMCCGEAPYLVSRYDSTTGNEINLKDRIGLLDRKFRIINENSSDDDWINYSLLALKSIYGYEFQGDNLYIARSNILLTYIDYYISKFKKEPDIELIKEVINIISWNIWQMDGLKLVIPYSCHKEEVIQISLFDDIKQDGEFCLGCRNNNIKDHNGKRCYIMDWDKNKKIKYIDLLWGKANGK